MQFEGCDGMAYIPPLTIVTKSSPSSACTVQLYSEDKIYRKSDNDRFFSANYTFQPQTSSLPLLFWLHSLNLPVAVWMAISSGTVFLVLVAQSTSTSQVATSGETQIFAALRTVPLFPTMPPSTTPSPSDPTRTPASILEAVKWPPLLGNGA